MEKFGGNALIAEKLMSFKAPSIFVIGMDGGSTDVLNAKDCSRTGEPQYSNVFRKEKHDKTLRGWQVYRNIPRR